MCQGICRNAVPRFDFSEFPSYNFEGKFFLHDMEDSRSKWQIEVSVLNSSAVFFFSQYLSPFRNFACINWRRRVGNERIETGVLVKRQKGKRASVERRMGECCRWKACGQCSRGDS